MTTICGLDAMHLDERRRSGRGLRVRRICETVERTPCINGRFRFYSRDSIPGRGPLRRGKDANITNCFPGRLSGNAEQQIARYLTLWTEGCDLVVDIHWNAISGYDLPICNWLALESPLAMGVASLLKCDQLLVVDLDGHPAHELNVPYVAFDLSHDTWVLDSLEGWLLEILLFDWMPPIRPMDVYLSADAIRREDGLRLSLLETPAPFWQLPDEVAAELAKQGFPTPLCAVMWRAAAHAHTGYWGEVAAPLGRWPEVKGLRL